jgi:hypothetical protein
MTELKTLKDIELGVYSDKCICSHSLKDHELYGEKCELCYDAAKPCLKFIDTPTNLRLEAIKWIKSMQDKEWDYDDEWACCEMGNRSEAIEWIKHFFNIKEEELR